jgi:hypothetical protein
LYYFIARPLRGSQSPRALASDCAIDERLLTPRGNREDSHDVSSVTLGDHERRGVTMKRSIRRRFWVELVLATLSGFALLITIMWRDWIELVFKVAPDGRSGSLEWAIVIALGLIAIGSGALARTEWRRAQAA